jgi:glycosyltransferase involved in cell wall biosynthesis
MEKLVSVIVPIYNVELYLKRCIQSIVEQTYKNLEILLIDDGSTDKSSDICDCFSYDSRVKIFHSFNCGVSFARNKGLNEMTGEYVLFVDSDDYISKYLVEEAVAAAEKKAADIVLFDFSVIESGTIKIKKLSGVNNNHKDMTDDIKKMTISDTWPNYLWNKLYRSELWCEVQFPQEYTYEDLYILPDVMMKATLIVYLPNSYYYYNQDRPSSITSKAGSMDSFNRYCHFKALQQHEKAAEAWYNDELLQSVQTMIMKEAIETIITDFGKPKLDKQQIEDVYTYAKKYANYSENRLNTKSKFLRWCILHIPSLAQWYGKRRYRNAMKILEF